MAITSLPSDYGIGTLGDAAFNFVDLLVDLKQRYWQILPIGPTSFGDSPYQSISAFAGNPYLIDLDDLVRDGLLMESEIRSYNWGADEKDVDYANLFENRFQILKKAFERFDTAKPSFRKFEEDNDCWLADYALFMAVKGKENNREWMAWEPGIRNRTPEALQEYTELLKEEILFWKFCQYKFYEQWKFLKQYANTRGIQIIGDIPLYMAMDSADVWADRKLFLLEEDGSQQHVAGSPPDNFSEEGQKWGNPVYDYSYMEEHQFDWWRHRIEKNAALYDVIRIDHFLGVVRYYTIPFQEKDCCNGKWNKGPGKKLTDVMEESAGDCRIIADIAGSAIAGSRKLLARIGWPGSKILMFAFDGNTGNENLPHNFEENNIVVYTGTHDNDTVVGYFRDKTEYELAYLYEYLNIGSKEEIPDALIRLAYSSIADVVIIPMQDILQLGNEARMNQPSTVGQNWKWRVGKDTLSEERRAWIRTIAAVYRR